MKPSPLLPLLTLFALVTVAGAEPWTLPRALDCALTNNPDARIAQQRILAAQAGLAQANAAVWPQLQLQSGYSITDNPMLAFGSILNQHSFGQPPLGAIDFNNVPTVDNVNVRGLAAMPLYAGGQIKAGRESARAGSEAAKAEARAVRATLAFEVTRAFLTVGKTRQFIRATEGAVQSYENNLGIARKRLQTGALLKADYLDVEVRLAQAREDLVRARNGNALARRVLQNLLGIETDDFDVDAAAPDAPVPTTDNFDQRPELAAMQHRERGAAANVRGARAGYLPKVSAFGGVDYDYGPRTGGEGTSFTAGALLQWNLWDGQLTRAKVAEARAHQEEISETERKLRLNIGLEVQQARLNLNEAGEILKVSERSIAQAQESLQLTQARYEQGVALGAQLFDAETALTAARVRRADAEANRSIAVAALRRALGLPQLDADNATR